MSFVAHHTHTSYGKILLMKKIFAAIVALCLASSAFAQPADVTVRYDVLFFGFRVATLEDSVQFGAEGSYNIESVCTAQGLLAWFGIDPIRRTSSGNIDEMSGHLLVDEYRFEHGDRRASSIVDRQNGRIVNDFNGVAVTTFVDVNDNELSIHDSLSMIYNIYAHGDNSMSFISHLYLEGRRNRFYEWSRTDSREQIEIGGETFDAVRYNRIKEGRLKSSVWYIPNIMMLPGFATVQVGRNIALEISLVEVDSNTFQ